MNTNDYFGWLEHADEPQISPASVWSLDEAESSSRTHRTQTEKKDGRQHDDVNLTGASIQAAPAVDAQSQLLEVYEPPSVWWTAETMEGPTEECELAPSNVPDEVAHGTISASPETEHKEPLLEELIPISAVARSVGAANLELQKVIDVPAEVSPILDVPSVDDDYESLAMLDEEETLVPPVRRENKQRRPRVLDESTVLPNEASFATVRLYQETPRNQSPTGDFMGALGSRMLRILPALLLGFFGIALVVLALKVLGNFRNREPASDAAMTTAPEHEPKNSNGAPAATRLPQPRPTVGTEDSRRQSSPVVATRETHSAEAKPKVRVQENSTKQKANPRVSRVQKERVVKAAPVKVAKGRVEESVSRTSAKAPAVTSHVETSRVPSGGGERPRRVHQDATSP